jgi:phosphoenolpyruvate carboxylase
VVAVAPRRTGTSDATPFAPRPREPMAEAAKLIAQLKAELASLSESSDPFRNPVLMLAHELSRRIAAGELQYDVLGEALHALTVQAFLARSRRLSRYLGDTDPRRNIDTMRRLARQLAADVEGGTVPFEEYKARVEREIFGAVLTGHPTFNLSAELMHALVDLATGRDENGAPLDDDAREQRIELARKREHRPEPMTLEREHELSQDAIVNLHGALRRLYTAVLEVGE